MRRASPIILLLITGCGASAPQSKVADIIANCESYKGKLVQAAGYLGECSVEGCFLAADQARWSAFESAWRSYHELSRRAAPYEALREATERVEAVWPIGFKAGNASGDAFIRKAEPLQHSDVVVTGTISKDGCTGWDDASHSYGIKPTDVRAWTSSERATATTH